MNNLAFIRIPKTGTTTFVKNISELFLTEQYPCMSGEHLVSSVFQSHGHGHNFFTIIRDPLQIYCSAYYFIKNRLNVQAINNKFMPDQRMVLADHIPVILAAKNIEEYLLSAPQNSFLTKYIGEEDINQFAFVGETTRMRESLEIFSRITGIKTTYMWENKNPKRSDDLRPYWVNDLVKKEFIDKNSKEYNFYNLGLERFNALRMEYL